jgi:peptide/nickel transport system permease protein
MTVYIVKRALQGFVVLIIVTLLVFLVMRLLPGDPILLFYNQNDVQGMQEQELEALRHEYGLDQPMAIQYFNWVYGLMHGDLGSSIFFQERVAYLIKERIPISLYLGSISFILSGILGILSGVVVALRRNTWLDNTVTTLANIGITVPVFWLGILFIYFLSLKLHLLPVSGFTSPFDDFWMSIRQIIMPVICLALAPIASLCRQTRSAMLEVIRLDYIRTAWSKGLKEKTIITRHALKNALIPVITLMGMQFAHVAGGMVLIETVFNIPGMGRLMVTSVFSQDYQVVQAGVLITAIMVLLCNLAVDISYIWFDPRIRYS